MRTSILGVAVFALIVLGSGLVWADPGGGNAAHAYLYPRDPVTWEIVTGQSYGMMRYTRADTELKFAFNAHGLVAGEQYTLVLGKEPKEDTDLVCLGSATAGNGGQLHLDGRLDTGDLMHVQVWLVPCADCDGSKLIDWNPECYLIQAFCICFDDTDE